MKISNWRKACGRKQYPKVPDVLDLLCEDKIVYESLDPYLFVGVSYGAAIGTLVIYGLIHGLQARRLRNFVQRSVALNEPSAD